MSQSVLECRGVKKSYGHGELAVEVLRNIDLRIEQGERVAIVGASGSGKSTLLNIMGGLDLADAGQVTVAGKNLAELNADQRGWLRNQHLGFVYQFHHLLPEFSALENVAMPLLIAKKSIKEASETARDLLSKVGLAKRIEHKPSELSGGERQRVAIARALATKPLCVLMDEPTGNLDVESAESIQQLMLELNRTIGTSFVVVTHDPRLAARMDRTLRLDKGSIQTESNN